MRWIDEIARIEAFEDVAFDVGLVDEMQALAAAASTPPRLLRLSTPTFKTYATSELQGCARNAFPAFSVTGGACALDCDHCQAKILAPMIPATTPDMLDAKVRDLIARQGLQGFLLSGGSNRRNEIRYDRFLPVIECLKRDFPSLQIAVHSALIDAPRARALAAAGVDTAMLDVIGSDATIREVYHLDRSVADFEASLAALCASGMKVVPHIVIGLHYGRLEGEAAALDICARNPIDALVLVVVMPFYAKAGTFATPAPEVAARVFLDARARLPDRPVLLGCARPAGLHKRATDAYVGAEPGPGLSLSSGVGQLVEYPYGTAMGGLNMIFATHEETVSKDPDLVRTILTVHRKSSEFMMANKAAVLDMTVARLGANKTAVEQALGANNVEYTWELTDKLLEHARTYAQQMLELKQIRALPDFSKFLNPTFSKAVAAT